MFGLSAAGGQLTRRKMINNIIVVSDLHCGCQLGLCPSRKIPLDGGGSYESSLLQKKVWRMWRKFWSEWVVKVTRKGKFAVVLNGDALNGNPHGAISNITDNMADQLTIAKMVLEPIVEACEGRYYHIRGTEAHVGKSGQYEEMLAESLGAIPDGNDNYARWEMWLRMNEPLIHFSHHIGATGSSAYESTAVYKEYVEACVESGRWKEETPDLIIRSHRHRYFKTEVEGEKGAAMVVVTPGWQLKTPYVYRMPSGRISTPHIGGILIRTGDEDPIYTRSKIWKIGRSKEVAI